MRMRHVILAVAAGAVLSGGAAMARGTLAMAIPDDIGADGFAIGVSWGFETRAEADSGAIEECYAFDEVEPWVNDLCEVKVRYDGQCVSVAMDPEPGTYGLGWAVAPSPEAAQRQALASCQSASTPERSGYCVIMESRCDDG